MKKKLILYIFVILIYQSLVLCWFGEDLFDEVKSKAAEISKQTADAVVGVVKRGATEGSDLLKKSEELVTNTAGKVNDSFASLGGKIEDVTKEAVNTVQEGGKDIASFFKSCGSAAGLYAAYISATATLKVAQEGLKGADIINLSKALDVAKTGLSQVAGVTDKFGAVLQKLTGATFNIKDFKIEGQIPTFNFQMNGVIFGKNINVGAGVDFDTIKGLVMSLVQKILPQVADVAGLSLDLSNLLIKEVQKI